MEVAHTPIETDDRMVSIMAEAGNFENFTYVNNDNLPDDQPERTTQADTMEKQMMEFQRNSSVEQSKSFEEPDPI